jgi:hypothetical protein
MSNAGKRLVGAAREARAMARFNRFTNSHPSIPGGKLSPVQVRTTRSIIGERKRKGVDKLS